MRCAFIAAAGQIPGRTRRNSNSRQSNAQKSESTDAEIIAFADQHDHVVFTKDEDFRTSYLLRQHPRKLVHIRTGNKVSDEQLRQLIGQHLEQIQQLHTACATFYLEISADRLTAIVAA